MGAEGKPDNPVLCGTCEIRNLDEEQQAHALEVGRAIVESPELLSQYGRALLRMTVGGSITYPQSVALISCIKSNRDGRCEGLRRPDGIYAVQ